MKVKTNSHVAKKNIRLKVFMEWVGFILICPFILLFIVFYELLSHLDPDRGKKKYGNRWLRDDHEVIAKIFSEEDDDCEDWN